MVLTNYLQKTPVLCVQDSAAQYNSSNSVNGYVEDRTFLRPPTLSRPRWGLLGPAARILGVVNNTVLSLRDGLTEEQRAAKAKKVERRQILTLRMKNAETMEQWRLAAKELDILEDNETWKYDSTSSELDSELIETRLKQLDEARMECDIKKMLNLVRTALSRDLGGMGDIRLYKHSYIGTKDLVERYIDSTLDTIRSLVEKSKITMPEGMDAKDILEQVVYARQAFGRSALLLSGGATFGMNHVGVLKALYEAKLLPRIIAGASAGSIVCAVLCTRTDEEIPAVLEEFPYGDLAVFEEEGNEDGLLDRIQRLLTKGVWIDIKHLTRVMQKILGDMTFQEAYNRTRRILNISVSTASVYELPRLLNYVTAPNVMIWSAVAASCSVPVLFSAAQLLCKNPLTGENVPWNPTPQRWIDGSVDNDLPMTRLAEMFNVNHFIVSQVNPHVVPFLEKDDEAITRDAQTGGESGPGWIYTLTNLAKDEALHRMHMLAELGIFPNLVTKARSVLSQKYSGDITILPQIDYKDFPRMLKNPTSEFMVSTCLCGERATWPKLSRIRNHCAVELELDAAVQDLRARVVFSPSQVDLRRMTTGSYNDPNRRKGRKRRDSGGNLYALSTYLDDENVHNSRKAISRPPLGRASTHFHIPRRHMSPLFSPHSTFSPSTPMPGDTFSHAFRPQSQKSTTEENLTLQIPDISSAGETSFSPPSSDADVDTHTDDSSPEPDISADGMEGLGMSFGNTMRAGGKDDVDYFSRSQPVTPGTDHILATSPASARTPMRGIEERWPRKGESITEPSSPELTYKRLFHRVGAGEEPKGAK
jgi:TAG lipase/steryl ester hydrolase/phospholipase A2/LPA acyltransferase